MEKLSSYANPPVYLVHTEFLDLISIHERCFINCVSNLVPIIVVVIISIAYLTLYGTRRNEETRHSLYANVIGLMPTACSSQLQQLEARGVSGIRVGDNDMPRKRTFSI